MTQTRLTEKEIQKLIERKDSLEWMMKSIADQLETASRAVAEVNNRIEQMVRYKTSDGNPCVEPESPLTDKDACVWPRLLVMVRDKDSEPWKGPFRYFGKDDDKACPFVAVSAKGRSQIWQQARRATPEEIEAAK